MTEPKSFHRGRRTYTRVGAFKEVRVETGSKKEGVEAAKKQDPVLEGEPDAPAYANAAVVRRSPDEVVMDLGFIPPGAERGRTRVRVAMSKVLAGRLGTILKKAAQEA